MKTSVNLILLAGLAVMLQRCVEDFVDREDFQIHFKFATGQSGIEALPENTRLLISMENNAGDEEACS
jgi:hypothetical protein